MNLHPARLLAFLAGGAVLVGLALPWKYQVDPGAFSRGAATEYRGNELPEALLLALLFVPGVVLAVIGDRYAAPGRWAAALLLLLGSLAFLLAGLLLGLFVSDPRWDAGSGFYLQLLGACCGLAAGILAFRRGATADPKRP
ncbi:MAG: hypothetical protein JNM56_05800 [Planctomycetia bacterium]|nr:hypothetical protein [Planctomycetia bacterium]